MSNKAKRLGNLRGYPVKAAIALAMSEPLVLDAGYGTNVLGAGTCVGLTTMAVDNSAGANGELWVEVQVGEHKFVNSGDITVADVGEPAYLVDGDSVSIDSATDTRSLAGTITQVDADGVWVKVGV